ncbi:Uncharacterised protein [uncultured archaeon]|nr:Uncharacterised protein [uncultured archaeon]
MVSGTKEWSDISENIQTGCEHDCAYCYARANALKYGQVKNRTEWTCPVFNHNKLGKKSYPTRKDQVIMFPTSHDITPKNILEVVPYLKKILSAGNRVLIVSKPHISCIETLCKELVNYKDQILFRFTIGSARNDVLKFWEPGAPDFDERLKCLEHAFTHGYQTSVSMEPLLDEDPYSVIVKIAPYITDAIWLGKMNRMWERIDTRNYTPKDWEYYYLVERSQTNDKIIVLYNALKNVNKIKWKESIKVVVGLPVAEVSGTDK